MATYVVFVKLADAQVYRAVVRARSAQRAGRCGELLAARAGRVLMGQGWIPLVLRAGR